MLDVRCQICNLKISQLATVIIQLDAHTWLAAAFSFVCEWDDVRNVQIYSEKCPILTFPVVNNQVVTSVII